MEIKSLYRVDKKNLEILDTLLTSCFKEDPLYRELIPNEEMRKRLLPELFSCDLNEFFDTCEIFADSPAINGIIVVSDQTKVSRLLKSFIYELLAQFRTDSYLIREDPTLRTLWNFIKGKEYLNSKWTEEIHEEKRLHIIYLAVRPDMQHHGISTQLIQSVLAYAHQNALVVSLETHNINNVPLYEHFGFKLFEIIEKHFNLKQYCMVYNPFTIGDIDSKISLK